MSKFLTLLICLTYSVSTYAITILIDPGHGGKDCGARANYHQKDKGKIVSICEKDIALSIGKLIKNKLKKKHSVYLTRSIDRDLDLDERSKMAETLKADLFISIHLNSHTTGKAAGFETFYLSNHKNSAVKKLESIENKNAKGDEIIINQILADLVIDRTAPDSKLLAGFIHKEVKKNIEKRFNISDRGIRPALFYVLALSKRPSVLLEAGFLSNQKEINKVLKENFQLKYANAVAKGIDAFVTKKYGKKRPSLF